MSESPIVRGIEGYDGSGSKLWALGGPGFAITTRRNTLYVDPFLADQEPGRPFHRAIPPPFYATEIRHADALLSTHEHNDHCNEQTVKAICANSGAVFIGPQSSCQKAREWGFPGSRVIEMRPDEEYRLLPDILVRAFDSVDPYAESALIFLIETPKGNIVHCGDTSYFDGFKRIGSNFEVDVALLNFGKQIPVPEKPYYMSAERVARAAADLDAKVVVPIHWDLFLEAMEDPSPIQSHLSALNPRSRFRVLRAGESLEL